MFLKYGTVGEFATLLFCMDVCVWCEHW